MELKTVWQRHNNGESWTCSLHKKLYRSEYFTAISCKGVGLWLPTLMVKDREGVPSESKETTADRSRASNLSGAGSAEKCEIQIRDDLMVTHAIQSVGNEQEFAFINILKLENTFRQNFRNSNKGMQ